MQTNKNYNRFTGTEIVSDEEGRLRRKIEEDRRRHRELEAEDGSNIVDAALLGLIEQGAIEIIDSSNGDLGVSQEPTYSGGGGDFSGGGASGGF